LPVIGTAGQLIVFGIREKAAFAKDRGDGGAPDHEKAAPVHKPVLGRSCR
jgi:hypothetical protein